jgi:hypothetical protein
MPTCVFADACAPFLFSFVLFIQVSLQAATTFIEPQQLQQNTDTLTTMQFSLPKQTNMSVRLPLVSTEAGRGKVSYKMPSDLLTSPPKSFAPTTLIFECLYLTNQMCGWQSSLLLSPSSELDVLQFLTRLWLIECCMLNITWDVFG